MFLGRLSLISELNSCENIAAIKTKTKVMSKFNYTSVCWYCGIIFKHNRKTGKHCCTQHRSLYGTYGSRISPYTQANNGVFINIDATLGLLYDVVQDGPSENGWIGPLTREVIEGDASYFGQLPVVGYILIVGSYALKASPMNKDDTCVIEYAIKTIFQLTDEERATEYFWSTDNREFM